MRWFTSDLHFWHNNVIKYSNRPFSSVEEMNQGLIANFNALVKPEDEVYCFGDFSLSTQGAAMRKHLNGTWYLIPGNHDKCHSVIHKDKEVKKANSFKIYEDLGFIILPEYYSVLLNKGSEQISCQACHFPFGEETRLDYTPKFNNIRPKPTFLTQALLHGHVHDAWKCKMHWFEEEKRFIPQINLGVDVWNQRPVSEAELFDFVKEKIEAAQNITEVNNSLIKVDLGENASQTYKDHLFEED